MCQITYKEKIILKELYNLQQKKVNDVNIFAFNSNQEICNYFIHKVLCKSHDCITNKEIIETACKYFQINTLDEVNEIFADRFVKEILHVFYLPKEIKQSCEVKIGLLKNEYEELFQKLDAIISKINKETDSIKKDIAKLKDNANSKLQLKSEFIRKLTDNGKKVKSNELYLEFIEDTKIRLNNTFSDFDEFKTESKDCVSEKIALGCLIYDKMPIEKVEVHFKYYFEEIQTCNHQLVDKKYIPMIVKIAPFMNVILEEIQYETMCSHDTTELEHKYRAYDKIFTTMKANSKTNNDRYLNVLKKLVNEELLRKLSIEIKEIATIKKRHSVLTDALNAYSDRKFDITNSLLVIQIEGIIYDFLIDCSIIELSSVYTFLALKDKVVQISTVANIGYELEMYFKWFFNQLRNEIAHGGNMYFEMNDVEKEITSMELLLDLNALLLLFMEESNEYKFKRFIKEVLQNGIAKNNNDFIYGKLYNELTSQRAHLKKNGIRFLNSKSIIFFLYNDYMGKQLNDPDDKKNLQKCKEIYQSCEFWTYILNKMKDTISTNSEGILDFLNENKFEKSKYLIIAVKHAFLVVEEEAKQTLVEINKLINKYV